MAYVDTVNKNSTDYALSAFGNVFINNQNANVAKTIDYSNRGFDQNNDVNLTVKVVFQNGHVSADTTSNMTLNGKPILVNKDGALIKIPIQTLTEGGVTVYRTLQANTTLEMYYTKSVSGYSNGAYVVIGNPVVISSASYTIYADGYYVYPTTQVYTKTETNNQANAYGAYWGNPIGTLISFYGTVAPAHYLICDGSYIPRTFNSLISLIGDYLPDFRECAIVGIGQNWRDPSNGGMMTHDVYTLGQYKDDCIQTHEHGISVWTDCLNNGILPGVIPSYNAADRNGESRYNSRAITIYNARVDNVTRGKRMGALICIRAE